MRKNKSRKKEERVKFEGRDLSLNTVKSYASNKKHPLHTKAKVFLEKKNKKKWTQKVEEGAEDLPTWGAQSLPLSSLC